MKFSLLTKAFEAIVNGVGIDSKSHFYVLTNNDQAPQGTIIHPSVYHCLDEFVVQAATFSKMPDRGKIENWRARMLGTEHHVVSRGFWSDGDPLENHGLKTIRILVCGNTGVGKSTLINQVFGVDVDNEIVSSIWFQIVLSTALTCCVDGGF